mmetsp:Transcript_21658/g.60466  ORF Transcript_21658/g.60466 Transcript_21658/m.60466 type:complete len:588 (+) Transcript_21658:183-1946(+)
MQMFNFGVQAALLQESHGGLVIVAREPLREFGLCLRNGELWVGIPHARDGLLLKDAALHAPVKKLARPAPLQGATDHAFRLHSPSAVVEVSELTSDLCVQRGKLLLARFDFKFDLVHAVVDLRHSTTFQCSVKLLQLGVEAVHHFIALLVPEFHLDDASWLEDAAARIDVCVHLHSIGIDGWVNDNPRATAKLSERRDVDKDRVLVLDERVNDLRAKLQHLLVHVARATRETTPIGKDNERQIFPAVEITYRRRGLESAVWEPNLPGLRLHDLLARRVGRVCGHDAVDVARLHCDHPHGDPAKLPTAHNHALAPTRQVLLEGAFVEETRELSRACEHVPRVVWRFRRHERNITLGRVRGLDHWRRRPAILCNEREPIKDRADARLVALHQLMGHAIRNHDLWPPKLVLRGVNRFPKELVQSAEACKDHRAIHHLDGALPEAVQVCTDSNRAPGDVGQSKHLVVGPRGLARDEAAALQVFDADAASGGLQALADDRLQRVVLRGSRRDLARFHDALIKALVVFFLKVEVLVALAGVRVIHPLYFDVRLQLLDEAHARTAVAGDINSRQAVDPRVLRSFLEEDVLGHTE